MFQMGKHNVFS